MIFWISGPGAEQTAPAPDLPRGLATWPARPQAGSQVVPPPTSCVTHRLAPVHFPHPALVLMSVIDRAWVIGRVSVIDRA